MHIGKNQVVPKLIMMAIFGIALSSCATGSPTPKAALSPSATQGIQLETPTVLPTATLAEPETATPLPTATLTVIPTATITLTPSLTPTRNPAYNLMGLYKV
ncbi:MAG TPA: hypothetical protein VF355_05390, partial [Anaerolineaceae bacterium]